MKSWTLRRTGPGSSMPWAVAYRGTWMGFFSTWREAMDYLAGAIRDASP